MSEQIVAVFGGTGFLGRRVVRALVRAGYRVRVAARKPNAVEFPDAIDQVEFMSADVRNPAQVTEAVTGALAVVNAVSLYAEKGDLTFDAIHVEGAGSIARCAGIAGAQRLVHISGLGATTDSQSELIQAKARGEQAVQEAFAGAAIVRPSVSFGGDDAFLASLETLTRLPVVPLFGRGECRLQPAYVMEVADAVAQLCGQDGGQVYELGGSRIYSYREALQTVMAHLDRRRLLLPVPFSLWRGLVRLMSILPNPPLTADQLMLMQSDNVVGTGVKTFADLGINPSNLEDLLDDCLP
jgi:uncharacterized protein YbjT (DUF2867 family)